MFKRATFRTAVAITSALVGALVIAAPALAADSGGSVVPAGFLGFSLLPSIASIVETIAKDFFGAFAKALVPSWLQHATVSSLQYLVALPDPASWTHVSQLQGDMVYLGVSLLPAALAVSTIRYWLVGLTGVGHPAMAVARAAWVALALVAYGWFVSQVVDGANTVTHAILAFPVVSAGLRRIISVLFAGALLAGAGGVLGALLVVVGVVLAIGLFAVQVALTVVLAVLVVAGPPLIALSVIPELAHLARSWAHGLLIVCLVPFGWTVIFAVAGALCLDATSFTGGAGGVPSHIAAALAGLATFVIAVRLPMVLFGQLRHVFSVSSAARGGSTAAGGGSSAGRLPGAERVAAARSRLRSLAYEGVPAIGASAGRAAGALGAPQGGAIGVARR
ncbi:MAG: hypothetical protein ACYCXW_11045, partial [Solirubrobacteraceae bacterium]